MREAKMMGLLMLLHGRPTSWNVAAIDKWPLEDAFAKKRFSD